MVAAQTILCVEEGDEGLNGVFGHCFVVPFCLVRFLSLGAFPTDIIH